MRLAGATLHRDVGARDFVACALAVLEPPAPGQPGPRLRLVNAAQVPPILCRDGRAEELEPPGDRLPLGVLPEPQYEDLALDLQPRDVIVFSSDGLVEAPALPGATFRHQPEMGSALSTQYSVLSAGDLFGFERLAASAAHWAVHAADAEGIAAGIWADVNEWSGETSDHDDMTLLVLRIVGT
jgi:serine phosphatase RsbU (regulator of sigma subunit)